MSTRHIYLADDDPDDYYLFSMALKEINSSIVISWFDSCEKLLISLLQYDPVPEIILLDMNMPRRNGQQCLQKIKEDANLNHIPIYILSTATSPAVIQKAYDFGVTKYFQKPNSVSDLKKIIIEILGQSPS